MSKRCICRTWCRFDLAGEVIEGRCYPAPDHANGCPAQIREPFTVLDYEGTRAVMEPHAAAAMVAEDKAHGITYVESTLHLTRDQFERMDEFQGF